MVVRNITLGIRITWTEINSRISRLNNLIEAEYYSIYHFLTMFEIYSLFSLNY